MPRETGAGSGDSGIHDHLIHVFSLLPNVTFRVIAPYFLFLGAHRNS